MNAFMDASTGYDQLMVTQIIRAIGQPFVMLTLSNFAMNGIAPKDMPSASSLFNMTRNLGGSIGIALLATTLTNREHFHSARIGESVSLAAPATQSRLDQLTQAFIAARHRPGHRGQPGPRRDRPHRAARILRDGLQRRLLIVGVILLAACHAAVVRGQGQVAGRRRRRRTLKVNATR
jgi:DHA2 family multidrug resistance protein